MINGDNLQNLWHKILYFPQCILSSFKGTKHNLDISRLKLKIINFSTGTPSRILCNMFWETIDYENLSNQLGGKVSVFDIACGKGHYGLKYEKLLSKSFVNYTGIDIYKHQQFPKNFKHILSNAKYAADYLDNHNFITSQSGLEHVEEDIEVLKNITSKLSKKNKPYIQIHLVPASASLFLYLWHGWRQYSARNLGNIAKTLSFSNDLTIKVIPLGGWRSFLTHFFKITIPLLISKVLKKEYKNWEIPNTKTSESIKSSVLKDRYANSSLPSFWAFIICSKNINLDKLFKKQF